MAKHDGWNSLGDIRALEAKVNRIRNIEDMAEWGRLTLKLVAEVDYLNGCVSRGKGSDIDSNCPARNIFEYIKGLETLLKDIRKDLANHHQCDDDRISVAMGKIDDYLA